MSISQRALHVRAPAVAAALAAGACFALREHFWPLAWVSATPVLWMVYRSQRLQDFIWVPALAIVAWAAFIGMSYAESQGWRVFLSLALTIPIPAILFTAVVSLSWFTRGNWVSLFAYPAAMTAATFATSAMSGGDTATLAANSIAGVPILIQSASFFGAWGIEFLLALFANSVALWMCFPVARRLVAVATLALCTVNVAFGAWRLQMPGGPTVRVAAAAQNLPLNRPLPRQEAALESVASYAKVAESLAAQGAQLIVLPELTSMVLRDASKGVLEPHQVIANRTGAWITVGLAEIESPERSFNVAYTLRPNVDPARYVKRHTLLSLDRSIRGRAPGVLSSGRAVAICKDLDFPATIRRDAHNGIGLMLVPAADFGSDGWSHARMALLRSVENGFSMVRAARNGVLTVSDWRGVVLARAESRDGGIASITAQVPYQAVPTIYRRYGDFFAWFCVLLSAVLMAVAVLKRHFAQAAQ